VVEHDPTVRPVTDGEVAEFWENGWVMLRNLISREVAAELLDGARRRLDPEPEGFAFLGQREKPPFFEMDLRPSDEEPVFRVVAHSSELGRNTARLLGRNSSVRLMYDAVTVKRPTTDGGGPTPLHQDGSVLPFDRTSLTYWIALDDVTPEMGSMRFRQGSHKHGLFGRRQHESEAEFEREWPRSKGYPLSEPITYQPGDATAHQSLTVHHAPANATDRPRWACMIVQFPADALYTTSHHLTNHLELELFEPFDRPDFPIVYVAER